MFDEVTFKLTKKGIKNKIGFFNLAVPDTMSIKKGLKLVRRSSFKTLFVVDEKSGKVKFAITQNEDYVAHAKKRRKKDPLPDPPHGPTDITPKACCDFCIEQGADGCIAFENGDCFCLYLDLPIGKEPLRTLGPNDVGGPRR